MKGTIVIKDLAVETNENGNYVIYGQHDQEGHKNAIELRTQSFKKLNTFVASGGCYVA